MLPFVVYAYMSSSLATRWCLCDCSESTVMAWQIAGYNDSYECDRWAACAVVSHGDIMWAWSQIGKLIVWAACVQGKIGLVKCEACLKILNPPSSSLLTIKLLIN